jgi:hypothetical protein
VTSKSVLPLSGRPSNALPGPYALHLPAQSIDCLGSGQVIPIGPNSPVLLPATSSKSHSSLTCLFYFAPVSYPGACSLSHSRSFLLSPPAPVPPSAPSPSFSPPRSLSVLSYTLPDPPTSIQPSPPPLLLSCLSPPPPRLPPAPPPPRAPPLPRPDPRDPRSAPAVFASSSHRGAWRSDANMSQRFVVTPAQSGTGDAGTRAEGGNQRLCSDSDPDPDLDPNPDPSLAAALKIQEVDALPILRYCREPSRYGRCS